MKKKAEFTSDNRAQAFRANLERWQIASMVRTETQVAEGIKDLITVVEWEEPDPNTRPCNCESGESWVDCQARSDWCG